MREIKVLVLGVAIAAGMACEACPQEAERGLSKYMPEIHGTVRAKYEYEPGIKKGRFEVRNARVGVEGKVVPKVGYKAEIDLSDEGAIKMLDAYVRYQPKEKVKLTLGQMRVPFTIDAHRSPHMQYFANRSFIAKQVGNVRDVGLAASWGVGSGVPIVMECGIFNGSGLTNQKNFWTGSYNFSLKVQAMLWREVNVTLSCQKANAGDTCVMMYDAGAYWDNGRWHVEGEYLRKHYGGGAFAPVNAIDAFGAYRLPFRKGITALSFLGRYDYMSDHSNGSVGDDGRLKVSDSERHRVTGGVTVSLGKKAMQADLRVNYEQYFYAKGVVPAISERSKIVVEVVAHF